MLVLFHLLVVTLCITFGSAAWVWGNHGTPPVYTGMAVMMSGGTPKLFGVGNGNLQERVWTGNSWVWTNHGSPSWGMLSGERLAATPCVLTDGKLFVVTSQGRLVERHWDSSTASWVWGHHNKPAGLTYGFRKIRCTTTANHGVARVFLVGTDFNLWERYWASSGWTWRNHGKPPGTTISSTGIDTCSAINCHGPVYVPGLNGNLYQRYVTPTNPGSWINMGKPTGELVRSVTASNDGGGVFITTKDNDVCRFKSNYNAFTCYGKPSGAGSFSNVAISKAVGLYNCGNLPGYARYIFTHSYVSSCQKQARFSSLKVTGSDVPTWEDHGDICSTGYYVESPETFVEWGCPKVFSTRSNGNVFELYTN